MKTTIITAALLTLGACTTTATCFNSHGHHPHDHHPACEAPEGQNNANGPTAPLPEPTPPDPELDPGRPNNGFGSGNQDASGKSELHNNAENAGGN